MRRHRASSSAGRPGNTGFYIGFEALLIISLFVSSAVGIVPPYRGSGSLHGHNSTTSFSWVPFRKPSRRLNLRKNGYKTRLLHDELCRYETDDMCKEIDEAMQSQARRSLQIARTSGQLKVLVILIQFKDHETRSMVPRDDIDYLFNGEGRNEIAPSGSVRSYMRINSYNKFDMKATVAEWVKIDKTEKECSFDNSGLDRRFQECVWPALDVLEARHQDPSDDFTWEDYDVNYDGFMDSVVVLHSGYSAEYGDIDPDGADEQVRIWSHAVGAQPNRWKSPSFLVDIGYYCVTSSFRGIRGEKIARIGILVHEMLHTLGLPDLYDLSRTGQGGGAGQFSIMSNPWGQGNDPTLPGHLDPWSKIKLGWVDPIRITQNQDITIQPSELVPDILMVDRPFPHEEYLLIENRQALHYDANMWSGGVLVWHIDDAVGGNAHAGGPFQSNWPNNGNHYQVALLQADGQYHLEQSLNGGDSGDLFTPGMRIGPGNGAKYPNTDSYQGGVVSPTGIELFDFQELGLNVKLTIGGMDSDGSDAISAPSSTAADLSQRCLVRVNTYVCDTDAVEIVPQEGCDCYQFCGNGAQQACCKFGEPCPINCVVGGLVAGCTLPDSGGSNGGHQDFFSDRDVNTDGQKGSNPELSGGGAAILGDELGGETAASAPFGGAKMILVAVLTSFSAAYLLV